MSKKTWLVIAVCLLVFVVFFAANKSGEKTSSNSEQVVVKVWTWEVAQEPYHLEQYEKFMKENPEIKIEHTVIGGDKYNNVFELAFKNNNTPDIFMKPSGLSSKELIEKGYVQPITKFIERDKELLAHFPKDLIQEGITVFDGEIYSLPMTDCKAGKLLPLYWNKKLFKQAGIEEPPRTWSKMREIAKKLTKSGAGQYYGFILGGKLELSWEMVITSLAAYAGKPDIINYVKGEYEYDVQPYIDAFNLILQMEEDGSIFPGIMAIDDEQARAYFATDKAAMIIGGVWNISGWKKYPSLDYGVAPTPIPDSGMKSKLFAYNPSPKWWMRKGTAHPEAVWKVFSFLNGLEFHKGYTSKGIGISIMPEAQKVIQDEHMKQVVEIAKDYVIFGPSPVKRNPDTVLLPKYESKLSAPKMTFLKAIMTGWLNKGKGLKENLQLATKERNRVFFQAMELARKDGIEISREDYIFPDFNPLRDYVTK